MRYGEQGSGKGILIHIGNQFAGNGEMILYILPVLLLLYLVWTALKLQLSEEKGETFERTSVHISVGQIVILGLIALMLISYFSGGWLASSLTEFLIAHVLTPLHMTRAKTVAQFAHTMSGLEEMVIYLGGVCWSSAWQSSQWGFPASIEERKGQRCMYGVSGSAVCRSLLFASCF